MAIVCWILASCFVIFLNFKLKETGNFALRCWTLKPSSLLIRLQDFLTAADERLQHLQSLDMQKVVGFVLVLVTAGRKHIITQFVCRMRQFFRSAWVSGQRFRFLSKWMLGELQGRFFFKAWGCAQILDLVIVFLYKLLSATFSLVQLGCKIAFLKRNLSSGNAWDNFDVNLIPPK